MAGARHKLNRNLVKGLNEPGRYNDGGGLYLMIRKSGLKTWIFRYMIDGRSRDMGLGTVSKLNDIETARNSADAARILLKDGHDPLEKRAEEQHTIKVERVKKQKFGDVLEDFFKSKDITGYFRTERTRSRWHYNLYIHAKGLHEFPIDRIETRDVYRVLEPMWLSKTETASRTRLYIESVLAWAKTMGLRNDPNPATWRSNLDQLLTPKERVKPSVHHPVLPWQEIPNFMIRLSELDWHSARLLEFIIFMVSRSGEGRGALWDEIDLENNVLKISSERMKMKRPHLVPLEGSLRDLIIKQEAYKGTGLVFPNLALNKEYSYNAPRTVLKRLGHESITTHGFRASFKTWALEATNYPTQAIEFALAHVTKNAVEGAYIRGDRMLQKRRDMMRDWCEYCNSAILV